MAGAAGGGRDLEETPTWAVAVVCLVLVSISMIVDFIINLIAKWLKKRKKRALHEALEKIKSELMLMGFISLLLTATQSDLITKICISQQLANSWHPCPATQQSETTARRRLFATAEGTDDNVCGEGKVALVSSNGTHQLHTFIFVLAVFHVLYCILTLLLATAKMRKWKRWEEEPKTFEYQFSNDPERFRFAKETSFGRRHLRFWTKTPFLIWIVCFFRQFVSSVPTVDYLTLRHGFMMAHLSPQCHENFDFRKYIERTLEEDFKVVVGISPPLWAFAVLFILFNTHGWYSYLWFPFIPLIIILLVGTKLQVIITKMGLRIVERGDVVKGVPLVQPGDEYFWFNRPSLMLHLINFTLFLNAFELAFLIWSLWQYGLNRSCFHSRTEDVAIRTTMGVVIQILCSYVTLPLYALVTQMGSRMKETIFEERVVGAIRKWHERARRRVKLRHGGSGSSFMSRTRSLNPTRSMSVSTSTSPVHLLRYYRSEVVDNSTRTSPRRSSYDADQFSSPSPSLSPSPSQNHNYMKNDVVPVDATNKNAADADNNNAATTTTTSSSPVPYQIMEIHVTQDTREFSFGKSDSQSQVINSLY